MAIAKGLTFKGIVIESAYVHIEMVTILPGSKQIEFTAVTSASKRFPALDKEVFQGPYDIYSAGNPLQQAYEYLKTLHSFAGAVDC